MTTTKSVLFVCMGNICRSPAGEGIMKHVVATANREHLVEVDSAGTINYHEGNPADSRMRRAASQRGYDLTSIARQVRPNDMKTFDLVIAMDQDNLAYLKGIAHPSGAEVRMLSDFLEGEWPLDVPDPYYGGDAGFEQVLDMIEAACPNILNHLLPD